MMGSSGRRKGVLFYVSRFGGIIGHGPGISHDVFMVPRRNAIGLSII